MRTTRLLAVAAVAALAMTACGGGSGDDDNGIASLGDDATTTTASSGNGDDSSSEEDFQEAALEFSQCMRDHGIEDYPDPQFQDDGGILMTNGGPGDDPPTQAEEDAMDAANEACQPILEEVEANREPPSPEEQAEMRDQALAFSECMREHGIANFPDPEFEENGGMRMGFGRDDGIDPSSAEFQDAQETCQDEVGFGPENGPGSEDG